MRITVEQVYFTEDGRELVAVTTPQLRAAHRREVWEFVLDAHIILRLQRYSVQTRASSRHQWKTGTSWDIAFGSPRGQYFIKTEDVPVPRWVQDAGLRMAREAVRFVPLPDMTKVEK